MVVVYIKLVWMTTSRDVRVKGEKFTSFQFDNTKYSFIAHNKTHFMWSVM